MNPMKSSCFLFGIPFICALTFCLHFPELYADGEDGVIRTKIDFVHGAPVVVKDEAPVQKESAKTQESSITSGDIVTPTGRIIPRNTQISTVVPVSAADSVIMFDSSSVSADEDDVSVKQSSATVVAEPLTADTDGYKEPIIITPDTAPLERGQGPLILMENKDSAIPDPVLVSPSSNPVRTNKPQTGPTIQVEKEEGYMEPVIITPETTRKATQTTKPVIGPKIITFGGSGDSIPDPVIVTPEKTRLENQNAAQTIGPRIIMSNDRASNSSGEKKSVYSDPVIISPDRSSADGEGPYIYNP